MINKYQQRGVSNSKDVVRKITKKLDLNKPIIFENENYFQSLHSDTAGTKPLLSYLYYKEFNTLLPFQKIVKDVISMNIDDLACYGFIDNYKLSLIISRNSFYISDEILETIILSFKEEINNLRKLGINIHFVGGETADVPDSVRLLDISATAFSEMNKKEFLYEEKEISNSTIIGLASFSESNSGIGTNGITNARHEILSNYYKKFPETYDKKIENLAYIGKYRIIDYYKNKLIGDMLISPTETYVPLLKKLIPSFYKNIKKIIHCTGGGQVKSYYVINENIKIVKNNLFPLNEFYELLHKETSLSPREILETFNVGHRLELYVDENSSQEIVNFINENGYNARIIGYTVPSSKKFLEIEHLNNKYIWS